MKHNILIGCVSLVASVFILGCDSSSSDTTENVDTGIGYYVDSAVEGVEYVCGTQVGSTDANGKFIFEKGKDCTFSVADITLRKVESTTLVDGEKVVEDNLQVAKFLQSIDVDGDASNGITLTQELKSTLKTALESGVADKSKILTDETQLQALVTNLQANLATFKGKIKTDQEVQEHLDEEAIKNIKNLLDGKTFYIAYIDQDPDDGDYVGKTVVEKLTYQADENGMTSTYLRIKGPDDTETSPITLIPTGFKFVDEDGERTWEITGETEDYLAILIDKKTEIKIYKSIDALKAANPDTLGDWAPTQN